jgi:hypothetical protein
MGLKSKFQNSFKSLLHCSATKEQAHIKYINWNLATHHEDQSWKQGMLLYHRLKYSNDLYLNPTESLSRSEPGTAFAQ